MACDGCEPKVIRQSNEAREEAHEKAQKLANKTGEWFVVYQDGQEYRYIRADIARELGIPGAYVSPKVLNTTL